MRRLIFTLMVVILILLPACSIQPNESTNILAKYAVPVNELTIPDGVQIIGLGEATHNNAELQSVRLDVFKVLVEEYGVRTFVLEENFATSELMNRYVSGEDIALQEAWKDWFPLYHTQEMAAIFNWMREYNQSVSREERLQYWGMDVQRVNIILAFLEKYLQNVDSGLHKEFSSILVSGNLVEKLSRNLNINLDSSGRYLASNETVYLQTQKRWGPILQDYVRLIEQLIHKMSMNAEQLISQSNKQSYEVAIQNARSVDLIYSSIYDSLSLDYSEENGLIHEVSRGNVRDAAMKEKVDWILSQVNGPILVVGHNAHISNKFNLADYYVRAAKESGISVDRDLVETVHLGEHLKNSYGDAYYTIGTSFNEGILASDLKILNDNNPPTFTVRSDNLLLNSFIQLPEDVYFLDFDRAKQAKQLKRLIDEDRLKMPHTGTLNGIDLNDPNNRNEDNYFVDMNLDETYDALINFRKVNLFTPYKL